MTEPEPEPQPQPLRVPMTVVSADGTPLACERTGEGPPVVLVGGGLSHKGMFDRLTDALSGRFTVVTYDRRGRGGSGGGGGGEPGQYSIDRETEDLTAVVGALDGPVSVFANCTGGIITVRAATRGLPLARLALYEPPYGAPPNPPGYLDRLRRLVARGRRAEAVTLFWRESVRFDEDVIERLTAHRAWETFLDLAPTLVHDGVISERHAAIPRDALHRITAPVLVLGGSLSPRWIQDTCTTLARRIPEARYTRIRGEGHVFPQEAAAPLLRDFFLS
ncbi:alpha/beta fold hydrolase [Streptomyces yaizuensis]|uniref:Alpha/beta hydrolase n=1 Tax=Streptomyces yaizuensis TaxID=2989713 RepID=A0ABQ5P861_9ACTN|nr:alpha/beta hydrolase [Streptomyces sp. YSPA8]GLF98775.1 alpha/beta hydrolase [Streptomyces sp. YSPA8]